MNTQENYRVKNTEKLIDELYNSCKKAKTKKIENLIINNPNLFSNFIIDETIRIIIRNYSPENKEFLKCLNILLKNNKNINLKNDSQDNATILMEAACSEKIEIFDKILGFFEVKKRKNSTGKESTNSGSKTLSEILEKSSSTNALDIDLKDNNGETVIHKIIKINTLDTNYKIDCIKKLINRGASLEEENILGETPLVISLTLGNFVLAEFLIKSGANIFHIVSSTNDSLLHSAIKGECYSVLPQLDKLSKNHKNKNKMTPLEFSRHLNLARFIEYFEKMEIKDKQKNKQKNEIEEKNNSNSCKNNGSIFLINNIIENDYTKVSFLNEKILVNKNNNQFTNLMQEWNNLLTEYHKFFYNEIFIKEENLTLKKINTDNKNKNQEFFLNKFSDFFKKNKKIKLDTEVKKTFFFNSAIFNFKKNCTNKAIKNLLNCLEINSNKSEFLFFTNSTILLINILQNISEFNLSNFLIKNLENFLTKSIKSAKISSGNINENKDSLHNSSFMKSLHSLYSNKEILNVSNTNDEVFCFLNIIKSKQFLLEDKVEESKKCLKEYKRLRIILEIKELIPFFDTLKNIFHILKMRIHYLNNNINKSFKHLNIFANNFLLEKNIKSTEIIYLEICKYNNTGILNLKLKKFSVADYNFKKALNLLKKNFNFLDFFINVDLTDKILFNLALCQFYLKNFNGAINFFKQISNTNIIDKNPYYNYRIALSYLELELENLNKINKKKTNEIFDVIKSNRKNIITNEINENENLKKNKIFLCPIKKSETSTENDFENNNDNDNNDFFFSENFTQFFYLLNNSSDYLENSKLINLAIKHFKRCINILKISDKFYNEKFSKRFEEIKNLYENKFDNSFNNENNNYNSIKAQINKNKSKEVNNIFTNSFMNLFFCLSLKKSWNEILFYVKDFETNDLILLSPENNYNIDNIKIEAYLGLNNSSKVIEILMKNMSNGNYIYSNIDLKGNFFSKIIGDFYPEINLKIALYTNVIKLNILNNNLTEVEKGIIKIIGLFDNNINLNFLSQNIESIILPSYIVNILISYFLIKQNYEMVIYVMKTRKITKIAFEIMLENTNLNTNSNNQDK